MSDSDTLQKRNTILGMIVAGLVIFGTLTTGLFFVWDANNLASNANKKVDKVIIQVEGNAKSILALQDIEDAINQVGVNVKEINSNDRDILDLQHVDQARTGEMKMVKEELKYHGDILKSIAVKVGATIPIKDAIK